MSVDYVELDTFVSCHLCTTQEMFVCFVLRPLTSAMICTTSLLTTTFNKVPYMPIFLSIGLL